MSRPIIGFVGMTHLGLISGVSASEKGFRVICFDPNTKSISKLANQIMPVSEPQLDDLVKKRSEQILFTSDEKELLQCDVIYVAPDVSTDDKGQSDLSTLNQLLDIVFRLTDKETTIVVLSQVPPGFTRAKYSPDYTLYYQVETLIFGKAVERALHPERYIVGCADPAVPLPKAYQEFLGAHNCPVLTMRYESAELAKISINMCLVSSVSTANTLAELCEKIGADWSEITPALKLDKRIGQYAYLTPGLGISGGNLERDLATVINYADRYHTDAGIVRSWVENSQHRKSWPVKMLREVMNLQIPGKTIGILGLAYKEDTHSTKNSPALKAISELQDMAIKVYDPIVIWQDSWHQNVTVADSPNDVVDGIDALMILTPWPVFRDRVFLKKAGARLSKIPIIDPYGMIPDDLVSQEKLKVYTLGRSTIKAN